MATFTYDEVTNKEALEETIFNMSPTDTPLTSMIGKKKVTATYVEFPEDELLPADPNNAAPEGFTFAPKPVQGRARTGNHTQIFERSFTVTGTQQAVDKTGVSDEKAYQMTKAMKQLAKDMELAFLNNVLNVSSQQVDFQTALKTKGGKRKFGQSGSAGTVDMFLADAYQGGGVKPATGVPRKLSGLQDLIYSFQYDGGPTVQTVSQALQDTWTAGGHPCKMLLSPTHKRIMSSWIEQGRSRNITLNKNMSDSKLVERIDVYESDFGSIEMIPSRFLINQQATDPITGKVLNYDLSGVTFVLDPSLIQIGVLRSFQKFDIPKMADAFAAQILGEYTLLLRGERGQAIIRGKREIENSASGGNSGGDDTVISGEGTDSL